MPYANYAEAIQRYPLLATWSQTNVESDLLYFAEMELNSLLASHFTVPFAAAHPTVKDLTIDLAYYRALRMKDPKKAREIREDIKGRIDDIKDGEEYIYTGSGTTIEPSGSGEEIWSTTMDYHPVHSMLDADDSLTMVSSERLQDEADERDV